MTGSGGSDVGSRAYNRPLPYLPKTEETAAIPITMHRQRQQQQQVLLLESRGEAAARRRGEGREVTAAGGGSLLARVRQAATTRGGGLLLLQEKMNNKKGEEEELQHQSSIRRREISYEEEAWARHGSGDYGGLKLRHMQESEGTTQVSGDDYGEQPMESEEGDDTGGDVQVVEEAEEEEEGDDEKEGLYAYAYAELQRRLREHEGEEEEEESSWKREEGGEGEEESGHGGMKTRERWLYSLRQQRGDETAGGGKDRKEPIVEEPEEVAEDEEKYERKGEDYGEEEEQQEEHDVKTGAAMAAGRSFFAAEDEGGEAAPESEAWQQQETVEADADHVEVYLEEEDEEAAAREEADKEGEEAYAEAGTEEDEARGATNEAAEEEKEESEYSGEALEEEEEEEEEEGTAVAEDDTASLVREGEEEESVAEGEAEGIEEEGEEVEDLSSSSFSDTKEDLAPFTLSQIESRVEVRQASGKGRCLYTRKALEPGAIVFVESPVFVATPSADADLWKTLEEMNEEEAFELPPVWHLGALCSLLLLDEEKRSICLDKWVPEPDKEASHDVLRILERTQLPVHPQLYERMLLVWRYNSFGHHSEQPGLVLYNRISMMAHSCSASACWHYGEGDSFILRSRVKLEPGDELTISYIGDDDLFKSTDVRREKVSGWLFTCCCSRCCLPVDGARGFRCSACGTGSMFFKTEDGVTTSSACCVCHSSPSDEIINYYLEFEQAYVARLSETEKTDLPDAKLVFTQAQRVFNQHWVLYQLHTILFEGHRDGGEYEAAAYHQMERIKYVSQVMPSASYTLAWLHEELGDTLVTKEEQEENGSSSNAEMGAVSDHKLNIMSRCFEDAYNLLYILCGKDHDYTLAAEAKKNNCDRRIVEIAAENKEE